MHRSISRWLSLQSTANFFSKSYAHESGQKNIAGFLHKSRAFTTAEGKHCFVYGETVDGSLETEIVIALHSGDRGKASFLLSALMQRNPKGYFNFYYILEYCMRKPDPLFAMETWKEIEEKQISMSGRCYFLILQALFRCGYLQEALNFLNFALEKPRDSFTLSFYNDVLEFCIQMKSLTHVNLCLDLMENRSVGRNEVTYWALLKLAVWQENISAVYEVWKEYLKYYCPSILSLQQFLWSFSKLGDLKASYDVLQHMVSMSGINFLTRNRGGNISDSRLDIPIPTLKNNTALMETKNYNNMQGVESWMNMSNQKRQENLILKSVLRRSFNFVIYTSAQYRNCRLAEHLVLQMQSIGLEPSPYTYDGLIKAIVFDRGFHDAIEVLKIMHGQNMKPRDSTLATLAIACSNDLRIDLAEALLLQITNTPFVHPFNVYFSACDAHDRPECALSILSKMNQLKLQGDSRTYELLFSLFGNVNAPFEDGDTLSQAHVTKRINAIELNMTINKVKHTHLSMSFMLRAFGREGMLGEMMQCFNAIESQFCFRDPFLVISIYNTVLKELVHAMEFGMAGALFKRMKWLDIILDGKTYNTMIGCCKYLSCFKSASAFVSMMIRDGFYPDIRTYTILIQIVLKNGDFDAAFHLLNKASSDGIEPDLFMLNNILEHASLKQRIDVAEVLIGQMYRYKIKPDASTCSYIFSMYQKAGYLSTAVEALGVLSMRIIFGEDEGALERKKKRDELENLIFAEDPEAEARILRLFNESNLDMAGAILNLRWLAILGFPIPWSPNRSVWVSRLRCYD